MNQVVGGGGGGPHARGACLHAIYACHDTQTHYATRYQTYYVTRKSIPGKYETLNQWWFNVVDDGTVFIRQNLPSVDVRF